MEEDKIQSLYNQLKDDGYELDDENTFKEDLKNDASFREQIYDTQKAGGYDMGGDFSAWEKRLMSNFQDGDAKPVDLTAAKEGSQIGADAIEAVMSPQQQQRADIRPFTQAEYDRLSPVAKEAAQGVGLAPAQPSTEETAAKIKEQLHRQDEGVRTQFVPEADNVVMATPTAETLKKYPWLKADEAVPFDRETGEPFYTWTDESGNPLSGKDIGIRTAKQEITGEREYMRKSPAALQLPGSGTSAIKPDGSVTAYVDRRMKEQYGGDYINGRYQTKDGRQITGGELLGEKAQEQYDILNKDIDAARIQYTDADENQRKELVDALAAKYKGLLKRESIERTLNDGQAQQKARAERRERERGQIDEAYNSAYAQRAAVMQENMRKAYEEWEKKPWYDKMFGGSPVQMAYWSNLNDRRIQTAGTKMNMALDARRVLDTGKAYDEGESRSGRLVRGMRDAMKDTGLYDGGAEEMHDLRNVSDAVKAYEAGNATEEQKDLLDTYALLQTVKGENADALGGMYGAGQTAMQAVPFMLQMNINPADGLGRAAAKAAMRYGIRTFGRSMMDKYMKRLLITSLKAGGRAGGDALSAAVPSATFGAPAIGADMYDRLIGNVRGTTDEQGNIRYSGRSGQETSKAAAIAKAAGSNYLEYQSEMVGEYFRPLTDVLSKGLGRVTESLGLSKVNDMIANISNKNFYRSFSDFARRTQWQGTIGEYLEEVVNNAENAIFIGDMDFSTGPDGVFNLDTNIDTFLGVAVMTGFMSSLKTADYIRTKGRLKDNLNNAYSAGLDLFGVNEWQRITDELDNIDDGNAASTVRKMIDGLETGRQKRAVVNYAAASLMNQGFNVGELKNAVEEMSDAAVSGRVPRSQIPGIESLAPEEQQNVHDDGMVHTAVLYPAAESGGGAQEVFVIKGRIVTDAAGNVDKERSDDMITYRGTDGQAHIASPDKFQSAAVPVSVEEYVQSSAIAGESGGAVYEPGQAVNINIDGNNYEATVQGVDGNGNVNVYYQDADGIDRPATFSTDELAAFNTSARAEVNRPTEEVTAEQPTATETEQAQTEEAMQRQQPSALERIPKDDRGEPVYEQADPDTAWDAIVEQAGDDEATAKAVADSMVADKEAELKKAEKAKSKGGTTVAEKIAAERERKNSVEQAKATLAHWQRIAQMPERRRQAAMAEQENAAAEAARLRREQEEKERAGREEADRIRREALNGVPDIIDDKPQDARARGYRRVNGEKVDRQQPLQAKQGKEVQVKFDDKNIPAGRVSLIEAEQLQPSHLNGQRNPLHFIDEAQPKERNDDASVMSARNIAANIRPEEITSSVTAYTGAPTVNARGEVIQGNNRSAALREMWAGQPEQAAKYKQYLADHAADFGLTPEDVEAMEHPVLVNMIDVADDDAITLGQFVAQDTESGGTERIKPKNIVQKMGDDMRGYAGRLLKSTDDEASFAELVDRNGTDVLKWMQQKGYITPTQYRSAFDSKGNLTAEVKNDLKGIMYQSIFQNGSTHLEEMFGALPAKAQKAILATAYRDYDSPDAERMNTELQASISAYYALSQMPEFADAKNYKEARTAAEEWKRQLAFDDVTGESYLPSERYSNFAVLLATMYKGQTQTFIQNTFNRIYDLVQGTQEETLFETPDNTPRTLVEAINETLSGLSDELLLNGNFIYDGQRRNNVLAGGSAAGQQGGQGSPGSIETGERAEDGDASSDRSGGAESDSGTSRTANGSNGQRDADRRGTERPLDERQGNLPQSEVKTDNHVGLSEQESSDFMEAMESNAVRQPVIELNPSNWEQQFGEDGIVITPIGKVKMGDNQIAKLFEKGRSEQFGMIKPTLESPLVIIEVPSESTEQERASSLLFVKTFIGKNGEKVYYFKSVTVKKDGMEVSISSHYDRPKRIKEALRKGKLLYRFDGGAQTGHRPADASVTASQTETQGLSESKDSENSQNSNDSGGKIAKAEEETGTNPVEEQKSPEATRKVKTTAKDTYNKVLKVLNAYYGLNRRYVPAETEEEKAAIADEWINVLDGISVDDIKAAAAYHRSLYKDIADKFHKASAANEKNPNEENRETERAAAQALDDWSRTDSDFNKLLRGKGDRGLLVAGIYVPFKENNETNRTDRADKADSAVRREAKINNENIEENAENGNKEVSLQQDNEADEVSQQIPQREYVALPEGDRTLAEVSDGVARGSRLYEEEHGGGRADVAGLFAEQKAAERLAKENGYWLPMDDVMDLGVPGPSGNESDTYISDGIIYKVNNLLNSGGIVKLFDKILLHNRLFPNTRYNFTGFTGYDGRSVYPVLSQRIVEGARPASVPEIDTYMQNLGFKKTGDGRYTKGDYEVWDIVPKNVLVSPEGNVYVVDAEGRINDNAASKNNIPQPEEGETATDYAHRLGEWNEGNSNRTNETDKTNDGVRFRGAQKLPDMLKEAYRNEDAAAIAATEEALRAYIESQGDMKPVAMTYFQGKDNMRRCKDKHSPEYRMNEFIADSCKDALIKAGIAPEALMGERKRVEFARKTNDTRTLDVISIDPSYDVMRAVIKNPHTSDSVLRDFTERFHNNGLDYEAQQVLDERYEDGNVIPLSERFNARKSDVRFRFIGEQGAARLDAAEEATTRLDNLAVAKNMEAAFNEKKKRIEKLRDSRPVEITGEEYKGKYELNRDSAKQWMKENLRGEYVNKDTGEKIEVSGKGVEKVTSHSMGNKAHIQSLVAVPRLIENAIFIEERPNEKGNNKYDSYRYYVCGLKIGGVDYTVKVTIGVKQGKKYYDHALTEIEKGNLIEIANGFTTTGDAPVPSSAVSKDTKLQSILQTNEQENARKIKLATGWERGADGKWRYETPDIEYMPIENIEISKEYKLQDVVNDDALFVSYPNLRKIKVYFVNEPSEYGGGAFTYSGEILINTAHSREEYYKEVLAHEIQHAIQKEEGFERGDNPDDVIERYLDTQTDINKADSSTLEEALNVRKKAESLIKQGKYKYLRWAIRSAMGNKYDKNGLYAPYGPIEELAKSYNSKELKRAYDGAFERAYQAGRILNEGLPSKREAERLYLDNAGETEARNVQRRLNMTPEERRASLAEETEDVAREDQIFLGNVLGTSNAMPLADSKTARLEKLCDSKPVEITGNEIKPSDDLKQYKKNALKYGKKLQGSYTNKDTGQTIQLQRGRKNGGINEVLQHNYKDVEHLQSIAAIPQIIENSIYIDSRENVDREKNPDVVEYQYYVCGLNIGGKDYTVRSTVAVDKNGNRYYDHKLTNIEKGKLLDIINEQAAKNDGFGTTPGTKPTTVNSYGKDNVLISILQTNGQENTGNDIETSVNDMATNLGLNVRVAHNIDEVTNAGARAAIESGRNIKGWYNTATGEIVVYLPDTRDAEDAMRTLLHEGVAHYGLRRLVGDENFDTFLDNIYNNVSGDVRGRIDATARKHGLSTRVATEEYLASLAEDGSFEEAKKSGVWQKIKDFFIDLLTKAGVRLDRALTDNELRYILWRSYDNLQNPVRGIAETARDIARQHGLNVGNYAGEQARDEDIEDVNRRFNEELEKLTEKNADKTVLSLGRPSGILRAAGVADKPMKLYGNKVIKKMKKHGFSLDELRDLPRAVANPIAVFNNYQKDGNRSILTDLRTANGNFLVTVDLGNDADVDFNIVTSVFGKGDNKILDWINKGYVTYINKEKAREFLFHQSAPIAATAANHELNTAANIVRNFDNPKTGGENLRYREANDAEKDLQKSWQDEYDRRTSSFGFKFTEAAQDGMKSVSVLQDVISKETKSPIKESEDVWALQNRLSSINKFEQEYYYENYYKPLMREVGNLVRQGAHYDELGRNMKNAQDDILKYLISKHGLERNARFRDAAAMEARKPYEDRIEETRKEVEDGKLSAEQGETKINKLLRQADEAEQKSRTDTQTKDYSGLSEMYGGGIYFDSMAQEYVDNFENKFDTTELWDRINAATKNTLKKTYEAGLISRSGYETARDMYEHYIPLRGWSNDVASEMYNYKGQQGVGGRIMKRAKGRTSLAENPLAVIGRMGQDGIMQANKNRVKQRLYNLAVGHDTSLLSISRQWYVNEGTKENPDWQRAYPELSSDMNDDQVAEALADFDARMKTLKEEGRATQRRDGLTIRYHTTDGQEQQHRVNVSIGGREYNIYVNGNPRAAQAINGELRADDGDKSYIQAVNRWLANVYTSLNPEFIVTNYERDAGFAGAIVAATEDSRYIAGWTKNMAKFNPLTAGVYMNSLINKATTGRIDPKNKMELYMQEFLANGGETGFTNMLTADDYKKLVKKEINEVNKPITAGKAGRVCFAWAKRANRVFEDATRFATYVTSREQGRSIDRAISDAKEISLNFNTRGADGLKNDGIIHKLFRNLRRWIIFTNPSIQGLHKAGVAFRHHPARSTIVIAGLPVVLGYCVSALASSILGNDDDDEVKGAYMDLPKWVRRTNICIPIGGTKFVTIPLSYELRVSYGMGEMFWEIEQGMTEPDELARETFTQLSDLLPLSFATGTVAQNLAPSTIAPLIDIIQNKDFTGRPIYREGTFNQGMPEYTKAYAGTAKWLVKSTEVLNEMIPKFWVKDYPKPDKYTPGAINLNPAIIEHLLDSYLGGLYTFPAKAAKSISMIWDEDMRDIRNIPFLNRNVKDSQSGNPINKSAGDRYNTYMQEYRLSKQRWDGYRRETGHGVTEFVPKILEFTKSAPGRRMFIIDGFKKSIDEIDKQIKDMGAYEGYGNDEKRKRLKKISNDLKQRLVNQLDSVQRIE